MTIAANIRKERKRRGWSQHELARRVGVHDCYISFWENDIRKPDLDSADELAQAFGITLDSLVHGEDQAFLPYGDCGVLAGVA